MISKWNGKKNINRKRRNFFFFPSISPFNFLQHAILRFFFYFLFIIQSFKFTFGAERKIKSENLLNFNLKHWTPYHIRAYNFWLWTQNKIFVLCTDLFRMKIANNIFQRKEKQRKNTNKVYVKEYKKQRNRKKSKYKEKEFETVSGWVDGEVKRAYNNFLFLFSFGMRTLKRKMKRKNLLTVWNIWKCIPFFFGFSNESHAIEWTRKQVLNFRQQHST